MDCLAGAHDQLTTLRKLFPIRGLVHVGAGSGACIEDYREWDVPALALIEANTDRLPHIRTAIGGRTSWKVYDSLVADSTDEKTLHIASNLNESGLVAPGALGSLWRNLTTDRQLHRTATTLAQLTDGSDAGSIIPTSNWLVIDCFPALAILSGAGATLQSYDVIIARAILDSDKARDAPDLAKSALDAFMTRHQFVCMDVLPERNPAVARIVYVSDWKARNDHQQAEQARDRRILEQRLQRVTSDLATSNAERDSIRAEAKARTQELDALKQARDEAVAAAATAATQLADAAQRLRNLEASRSELRAANDATIQQLSERESRLREIEDSERGLRQVREEAERRIGELEQRLQSIASDLAASCAERDRTVDQARIQAQEIGVLQQARDEAATAAAATANRLSDAELRMQSIASELAASIAERDRIAEQAKAHEIKVLQQAAATATSANQLAAAEQRLQGLTAELAASNAERDRIAQQVKAQAQAIEALRQSRDEAVAEAGATAQQLAEAEQQLQNIAADHARAQEIESLKQARDEAVAAAATAATQLADAAQRLRDFEASQSELRAANNTTTQQLSQRENRLRELEQSEAELRKTCEDAEQRVSQLEQRLRELEASATDQRAAHDIAAQQTTELQSRLQDLEVARKDLMAANEVSNARTQDLETRVAELKQELATAQDTANRAEQRLRLKQADLDGLRIKCKGLTLELDEKKAAFGKLHANLLAVARHASAARSPAPDVTIRNNKPGDKIVGGKQKRPRSGKQSG